MSNGNPRMDIYHVGRDKNVLWEMRKRDCRRRLILQVLWSKCFRRRVSDDKYKFKREFKKEFKQTSNYLNYYSCSSWSCRCWRNNSIYDEFKSE